MIECLRFAGDRGGEERGAWPAELLEGVTTFARRRLSERAVCRLTWGHVHGMDSSEWAAFENEPSDLGLRASNALTIVEEDRVARLTLAEGLKAWTPTPWSGLYLDFDVPPGTTGFPEIYGACHWYIWWHHGWRTGAMLEYPSSSVGRDARWQPWLDDFCTAAIATLGMEVCIQSSDQLFETPSPDEVRAQLHSSPLTLGTRTLVSQNVVDARSMHALAAADPRLRHEERVVGGQRFYIVWCEPRTEADR